MSDEWKSERPTESGYYFYHERRWINKVRDSDMTQIVYIHVRYGKSTDILEIGTDDPTAWIPGMSSKSVLVHPTKLAYAYKAPKDLIFTFTPKEETEKRKKDTIEVVVQIWLSKLGHKRFDLQADIKDLKIEMGDI